MHLIVVLILTEFNGGAVRKGLNNLHEEVLLPGVTIVRKDFFIAVGQYVKRSGKTYYKGDDGKLYKDYAAAAQANYPTIADRLLGTNITKPLANILDASPLINAVGSGFQSFGRSARAALDPNYAADEYAEQWAQQPLQKPVVKKEPPTVFPAGVVDSGALVSGLTPAGTVDRSQSDEYKSQMAQYRNLIAKEKQKEAEDLGMKIWMEKYGGKLGLTGPNPLMEDFGGFIPTQGPTPATLQPSEGPLKAFGQEVKTYFPGAGPEGFNPLDAQDQQQAATASQADMATTVKLPVRNRVQAFLQGGM